MSSLPNDYLDWPHVAQVFLLDRLAWHCQYGGKTRETICGLTSLSAQSAGPTRLLALTSMYWGIENGLHYRRDVAVHEDATRLIVGQAGHNLAILNNRIIGLSLSQDLYNLAQALQLILTAL